MNQGGVWVPGVWMLINKYMNCAPCYLHLPCDTCKPKLHARYRSSTYFCMTVSNNTSSTSFLAHLGLSSYLIGGIRSRARHRWFGRIFGDSIFRFLCA
jgi:hypothetical protein